MHIKGGAGRSRAVQHRMGQACFAACVYVCIGVGAAPHALGDQQTCVNESTRASEVYAAQLPDCRAYEQVSPPEKNFTDASGQPGFVHSSPNGEAVIYFSLTPFPGIPGPGEFPTYLSTRRGSGWETEGLLAEAEPGVSTSVVGVKAAVVGLTENLGNTIVDVIQSPLEPETNGDHGGDRYIRSSATGAYQLFAHGFRAFSVAASTPDGTQILFEDKDHEPIPGIVNEEHVPYLYEWNEHKSPSERVTVVGKLPDGSVPAEGAVAGAGGPLPESEQEYEFFYSPNAISEDGSRIFFSDVGTGQIYTRKNGVTVQVSQSRGGPPEEPQPAYWRAATPSGRYVFFTSTNRLTADASATAGAPDLYRFDTETEELTDLTSAESANVQGTFGVSADGSYAFFVATGVLAGPNREDKSAVAGDLNVYAWHAGENVFIADLGSNSESQGGKDISDWRDFESEGGTSSAGVVEKSSRVAPNGAAVLFGSTASLTGYDNAGHVELYLYESLAATLKCVSCDHGGTPATSGAYLTGGPQEAATVGTNPILTHNLSEDGRRVFFQTEQPLVAQATNGSANVYEWESEGEGGCPQGQSAGCIYLISTGQDPSESYFGDASSDGRDVFFFTRQSLVSQDRDDNTDLYDARVEGGLSGQNPSPAPAPCKGEECLGTPSEPPSLGTPSSAVFPAVGNLALFPTVAPKTTGPMTRHRHEPKTKRKKKRKRRKSARIFHGHRARRARASMERTGGLVR